MEVKYTDAHCHAHEFEESELARYAETFAAIVAVSDDLESSIRTVRLAERFGYLVPCVGIHPWSLKALGRVDEELRELERLVVERGVRCLGEVGLDLAFTPETYDAQLSLFRRLLEIARDHDLALNLHTAKAWRQALEEVSRYGIRRALFHWYTGPPDVLSEIVARGYLVSINPTVRVSEKHREVARRVALACLAFESDGPYQYRGLYLTPDLIPETVRFVAEVRGVEPAELVAAAQENLERLLG